MRRSVIAGALLLGGCAGDPVQHPSHHAYSQFRRHAKPLVALEAGVPYDGCFIRQRTDFAAPGVVPDDCQHETIAMTVVPIPIASR